LKSKKLIEIAKISKEKTKREGEKTSLFVVNNPKRKIVEINKIKKESLKFKIKINDKERRIKTKRRAFINLFAIKKKIKKVGKRQAKRIAKEFGVPIVLKEICLAKSNGRINFSNV